jgi:hypothetical protein
MLASPIATGVLEADGQASEVGRLSSGAQSLLQNLAALKRELGGQETEALNAHVLARLFDMGLFALTVPREFGGLGADHRLFAQAMVEVGRLGAQYAITAVPHLCNGVKSIALFGTEAIRRRVFDDVVHGRRLISFALTEDHTGSDVASLRSRLEEAGDGRYLLNGSKLWITNVPLAGHIVIVARCPSLSSNPKGTVFVVVPRDQAGLSVSRPWRKLTADACETVSLFFDAALIAPEQLFGKIGGAIDHFNTIVEAGRLGTAGGALGLAVAAWDSVLAAPCCPQQEFADLEAESRLLAMQQVLARSAFYCDAEYADHAITTAFCKAYCSQQALDLVRAMHERCADLGLPPPAMLAHALKALPLFKVLEGPTEVICLHAGIALLTRFGSTDAQALAGGGSYWAYAAGLLARFQAALGLARNVSGLVLQQNLVLAVSHAGMCLHAALCVHGAVATDGSRTVAARAADISLVEAEQALQSLEAELQAPSAARSEALFARMPKAASECYRF